MAYFHQAATMPSWVETLKMVQTAESRNHAWSSLAVLGASDTAFFPLDSGQY